jgi:hypothetical protein
LNQLLIIGIRLTFREPETSSLKTSFQEKVSLQIAIRQSSP